MKRLTIFPLFLIITTLFIFSGCEQEEEENSKPTCSITNPKEGASISRDTTVTISVEAEDEDGKIEEVRFYVDSAGIGSTDSFPYNYEWKINDVSAGTHIIKVEAIDEEGASGKDTIQITVVELNRGTFVDQRDGQEYEWLKIGDQVWMAENLKYLPSVVGIGTSSNTDPYYYVYGYDGTSVSEAKATENYDTYGVLYNWNAVMQGESSSNTNPSGVQGVCPDGWHVPSDEEWKELEMQLGMSQSEADNRGYRGTNEGSKLAGNASLWYDGVLENNSRFGSSGFTALPGGVLTTNGNFGYIGDYGYWWSSTENSSTNVWHRKLGYLDSSVIRDDFYKGHGFSVRCVRDD